MKSLRNASQPAWFAEKSGVFCAKPSFANSEQRPPNIALVSSLPKISFDIGPSPSVVSLKFVPVVPVVRGGFPLGFYRQAYVDARSLSHMILAGETGYEFA